MAVDPTRWDDLPEKLARLGDVARGHGLDTLVLRDPPNLTWLLGARVNVPQTLDTACLDVVVHVSDTAATPTLTIVTNAIEAPRLREAELAGLDDACGVGWDVVPWWDGREPHLPTGHRVGTDRPLADSVLLHRELAGLRRRLTASQRRRLAEVCRDAAAAATAAAHEITPSTTGYGAAAALARELLDRELDPIVLLVGGADVLDAHRHPLPTRSPLGDRALLVACGRRHGLVASVSRIVSFAALDAREDEAYRRLLAVEQAFLDTSTVGARLGEIVARGCAAYADNGFAPEEWHRHHQGGLSGFVPREFPAHVGSDEVLQEGTVVAWNPSGAGWKVEDTTLVLDDGPRPLVHDDAWPTVVVGGRPRPGVLVR